MKKEWKRNLFISTLIFSILMSFIVLRYINKKVSPVLLEHAELETKRVSTVIINKAIEEEIKGNVDENKLFSIVKNSYGDIQTIDFNSKEVNKILNDTTKIVLNNLKSVESGTNSNGIISRIPMGVVTNNTFLSNFGPKIPIKLNVVGSVESNIKTSLKGYGINNALMEIYISVDVYLQVNIPFISKRTKVGTDIPILIKIIQGTVPKYYGGNLLKESTVFSIPTE